MPVLLTKGLALASKPGGDPRQKATFHARLGRVLKDADRHAEAMGHFQQAFEISRQAHGAGHPNTIRAMLQVARVHQQLGRESTGAALAEEALRLARSQARGQGHDDQLVRCLHMLALIYQRAERYSEQEPLLHERLDLARRRRGEDHPESLHALSDLGVLRFHQRQYVESERLLTTALEGRRKRLGDDYPETLELMIDLARTKAALRKVAEARALFNEMLDRSARALGVTSPYRQPWLTASIEFFEANGEAERAATLSGELRGASRRGTAPARKP